MVHDSADRISVDQEPVVIPDLTIKDLLGAIPYADVSPLSNNTSISSLPFQGSLFQAKWMAILALRVCLFFLCSLSREI